jgi:bacillithiol biosynthesis cysteine-adding enzyme BshC
VKSECLSFKTIPHSSHLFLDYLYDFAKVQQRFYRRAPFARGWIQEEARTLRYDDQRRERVAAILERQNRAWGASPATLDNIQKFRAGAAVVVTGQQVGLFGGPLFSIYKALTAIKLAVECTQSGVPAVPVFWLATEDHDLDEVNHVTLLGPDGTLKHVRTEARGSEGAPMAEVRLSGEIEQRVAEAAEFLGSGEVCDFLRKSYRPGETLGGAFAQLFSWLFSHSGVILIDASDPELHQIAASVYRAAIVGASDLEQSLLERNRELETSGYHAQVHVAPSSTLLFSMKNGARHPVHRGNGNFVAADESFTEAELLARIAAEPQQFSANVLLRPVVEDFLLPTLAYVGGPAEVAYFAQAAVVYEQLVGRITPVLPRFSATVVEPRLQRLLQRYGVTVADTFHGAEHLRVKLGEHALPEEVNASFDSAAKSVQGSLERINQALSRLDPTLIEAAERAGSKMSYQLERLRERAARALLRRSEDQAAHSELLISSLYPEKGLQEREIGAISLLARYGTQLLLTLYDAAQTSCPDHQVVYL